MSDRILVVDDENPILFAMKGYFTTHGYEVDCAREFEEAEALLANIHYSVVVADLRLTGINGVEGLELVAWVRERCPRTHIIILTAYGSPEIEKEALRCGVDAFLRKPIPLPQLAQIVFALNESRPR
ncbi:MAG TPA: response regulator [Blastocatellia bacterium]|nr:response regulator [Blastocatellia bacterium]